LDSQGQGFSAFTGTGKLAGGDLNGNNGVNLVDYSILKSYWTTTNPVADINGDGIVNTLDYTILKVYWGATGDIL
jgi:hypothetical protein